MLSRCLARSAAAKRPGSHGSQAKVVGARDVPAGHGSNCVQAAAQSSGVASAFANPGSQAAHAPALSPEQLLAHAPVSTRPSSSTTEQLADVWTTLLACAALHPTHAEHVVVTGSERYSPLAHTKHSPPCGAPAAPPQLASWRPCASQSVRHGVHFVSHDESAAPSAL